MLEKNGSVKVVLIFSMMFCVLSVICDMHP